MNNNNKFLLQCLEEKNGEREYLHRSVHALPDGSSATAERIAQNHAKEFYAEKCELGDGGYYFSNGEVFVGVRSMHFIDKKDFDTLRKYL